MFTHLKSKTVAHVKAFMGVAEQNRTGTKNDKSSVLTGKLEKSSRLLQRMAQRTSEYFTLRCPQFLKTLDTLLTANGNLDLPEESRNAIADLRAVLNVQEYAPLRNWIKELSNGFLQLPAILSESNRNRQPKGGKLSLVEKREFEYWVISYATVSRLEARLAAPLSDLQKYLSALTGSNVGDESNPVGPSKIVESFRTFIQEVQLSPNATSWILKALVEGFLGEIEQLYEALSSLLALHGVLPRLEPPSRSPSSNTCSRPMDLHKSCVRSYRDAQEIHSTISRPSQPKSALDVIGRVIGPTPPAAASPPDSTLRKPALFGLEEVLGILDRIHAPLGSGLVDHAQRLLSETTDQNDATIDPDVRSVLNATENLVGSLAEDPKIPKSIKRLLQGVEIPLVRIALESPDFLKDRNHTVMRFLDGLEHLALALSAEANHSRVASEIKTKIGRVVESLSDSTAADTNAFDAAETLLDPILRDYRTQFDENTQRVIKHCKERQAIERAKKSVRQELNKRIAGKSIPTAIVTLLSAGWSNVLVKTLLQEGENGDSWTAYIGVIDQLIVWMHQSDDIPYGELADFLALLERGFSSMPVRKKESFLLLQHLKKMLAGNQEPFLQLITTSVKTPAIAVSSSSQKDRSLSSEQNNHIQSLKVGEWLIEKQLNGISRPLNLVWIGDDGQPFVFVNGQGDRALECNRVNIAKRLSDGQLSILEDGRLPLIERTVRKALKNAYEKTLFSSQHDALTGLPNRRAFGKAVAKILENTEDKAGLHTLLLLDIDRFFLVNNRCGEDGGDRLLTELVHVLRAFLDGREVLARIGNDEFAVFIRCCPMVEGREIAETLGRAVGNYVFRWGDQQLSVTASIGVVELNAADGVQISNCLKQAYAACRLAVESGGNTAKCYELSDQDVAKHEGAMTALSIIDEAIKSQRLQLFAQRISPTFIDLDSTDHFEILTRVYDDKDKLMPVQEFFLAAEKYGKATTIDRWVITALFAWMEKNLQALEEIGGFSVNLSGQSLEDASMLGFISQSVSSASFKSQLIGFEVTETAAVKDLSKAKRFIQDIRKLGCTFFLDDFGTGAASYLYLKDLPVDYVKVDGAFIRDIATNNADYMVVKSITEVAHFMEKKVVAEFVENEAITVRLRELGVDYMQGYHLGRPVRLRELQLR
jgi:diguanylate cyclase (GGDEF)-like protein